MENITLHVTKCIQLNKNEQGHIDNLSLVNVFQLFQCGVMSSIIIEG